MYSVVKKPKKRKTLRSDITWGYAIFKHRKYIITRYAMDEINGLTVYLKCSPEV
jgi:hypothetical protein